MSVYEVITQRVLDELAKGTVPWRRPFSTAPAHNLISRQPYHGVNRLLLGWTGYASPYWVTFRQAQQLGGSVKRGEHGMPVVYYSLYQKEQDGELQTVPIARQYTVFNIEQCTGVEHPAEAKRALPPIDRAEQIVAGMPVAPRLVISSRACYVPTLDTVEMPNRAAFFEAEGYYAVLFHELAHATGHSSRLGRLQNAAFGSPDYAYEELIAEFASAMLCGEAGISPAVVENQAAYISSWQQALENDSRLVIRAASAAQKAADWIMAVNAHADQTAENEVAA